MWPRFCCAGEAALPLPLPLPLPLLVLALLLALLLALAPQKRGSEKKSSGRRTTRRGERLAPRKGKEEQRGKVSETEEQCHRDTAWVRDFWTSSMALEGH